MAEKDGLLEDLKINYITVKENRKAFQDTANDIQAELDAEIQRVKIAHAEKHAEFLRTLANADEDVETAESNLRDQLKEWYGTHGEKTYDANLSVRVNTTLEYDKAKATAWAKENAPFILVVDDRQFKDLDIARTLDFVTVNQTVSTVIKGL